MQLRVAVTAHHEKACAEAAALRDQHVGRLVLFADSTVFDGVDAVMAKVQNGIVGFQIVVLVLVLTFHDENTNLARLMQEGEGFGEGARRFPAPVPRHDNVVQGRETYPVIGNQK